MRVRLLMDTVVDESEIPYLAELIGDQPSATVQITGLRLLGARFMGAQPVVEEDH